MIKKILLNLTLILLAAAGVQAQAIYSSRYGFSIEPLPEWDDLTRAGSSQLQFAAPDKSMALIVRITERSSYIDPLAEFDTFFTDKTVTVKERETFIYNGYTACLGYYDFNDAGEAFRGYLLWVDSGRYEYWINVFADRMTAERNMPVIFSLIDSFSLGPGGRTLPGPVSQYDYTPSAKEMTSITFVFNGKNYRLSFNKKQFAAAQRVVEREAMVMGRYTERNAVSYLAWARYYRAVYRDSFSRLLPVYSAIKNDLPDDPVKAADMLLEFCQNYSYTRNESYSDLIAPVISLVEQKGDCDSLSLAYIILLNHHKIDGALFLSQKLAHAFAGAKVDKEGVYKIVFGEKFIGADLTTKESLGVLPAAVVETTDWFPLLFPAKT
jgi:hypothetical protein